VGDDRQGVHRLAVDLDVDLDQVAVLKARQVIVKRRVAAADGLELVE